MSIDKVPTIEKLTLEMKERSFPILERFHETSISGVNHPILLSMLADVKAYWKDSLRPSLVSYSSEAVGGKSNAAEEVSLMITLMGAGLGIHDDIIDQSLSKHARMTILGLHGVDNALLIGELFIVKSLTVIREMIKNQYKIGIIEKILEDYEKFFLEVWEGEFLEILCRRNCDTNLDEYLKVLWMSTADSEACTRFGAILGGGSNTEVEALAEFGRRFGYMFRLADDIKDTLNLEGNLPSRLINESLPLPILYTAKSSKENYLKIKTILEKKVVEQNEAWKITQLCFEAEAFQYVLRLAKENETEAINKLNLIRNGEAKETLAFMVKNAFAYLNSLCP
jgi:geranylgeranyl pyrophosphate synthase